MTNLAGLLARVRAARGPDRELDGDIANALSQAPEGFRRSKIRSNSMMWAEKTKSDWDHAERWDAPRYSASIDAALALVERGVPGAIWEREVSGDIGIWWRESPTNDWIIGQSNELASVPLTILAAAFETIIAKERK